jgi:hypothetical protein
MSQSDFESPLVPREIADAPDVENVPVANWMHTLSQTVMEMHYELRRIGERLGGITGSGAQNATQGSASPLPGMPGGPEGATGAPGGAHGLSLGDKLRHIAATEETVLGGYVVDFLAERADALERERDQWRAEALKAQEDRGDLLIDLRNVREVDGLESAMRTSAGARMRDWLARRLGGTQ